ncbi:MAG: cell wall hydrolase [Hyphomicrobiaceae bacterium]|nr:cell wall hydrolase [Hyphomicrobiaceae bacterium]
MRGLVHAHRLAALATAALLLAGCSGIPGVPGTRFTSIVPVDPFSSALNDDTAGSSRYSGSEKECLMRAMYFESNRSSEEGMFAVGTVVMNRVADPRFPDTICGVVGQPHQFAPGILSSAMTEESSKALASRVADRILGGARHPGVRTAKYFHQAGLRFPYGNMHYVLEAGGNEFYIKT